MARRLVSSRQRWLAALVLAGIAIGISVVMAVLMFEGDAKAEQYRLRADYWRRAGQSVRSPVARLCGRYDRLYVGDWHFATFNLADSAFASARR
jgi:signal peptidase II